MAKVYVVTSKRRTGDSIAGVFSSKRSARRYAKSNLTEWESDCEDEKRKPKERFSIEEFDLDSPIGEDGNPKTERVRCFAADVHEHEVYPARDNPHMTRPFGSGTTLQVVDVVDRSIWGVGTGRTHKRVESTISQEHANEVAVQLWRDIQKEKKEKEAANG
jgi:hypothetical protein